MKLLDLRACEMAKRDSRWLAVRSNPDADPRHRSDVDFGG
jgi:hypothetical protein